MVGKYKVITLCGSTRFKEAFLEVQKRLTLEGNIVISVGLFGHSGDEEVWTESTKEMLDDMHLRKIDMADEVFVINVDSYIGSSTSKEIEYAQATGKSVKYLVNVETPSKRVVPIPETNDSEETSIKKGTREKPECYSNLSGYSVLASKKHPSNLSKFSEQCAVDLSKAQTNLKISQVVLRVTTGQGRCKDDGLEINYHYKIQSAVTAGKGKYLKYEIHFAGTEILKGIVCEIRKKSSKGLLYRIYSDVTYGTNKIMKFYVPFDPEMVLPDLELQIVRLQKKTARSKTGNK